MVLFGMRHEKRRKVLPGVRCKASGENDGALRKLRLGERRFRKDAEILSELRRAAVKRTSKKDVSMRYVFLVGPRLCFPQIGKLPVFGKRTAHERSAVFAFAGRSRERGAAVGAVKRADVLCVARKVAVAAEKLIALLSFASVFEKFGGDLHGDRLFGVEPVVGTEHAVVDLF